MMLARERATIDVVQVKHFLWNGKTEWDNHTKLIQILSDDPIFDKQKRLYMGKKERYLNGLAMFKRLVELKEKHNWSEIEFDKALNLSEEGTGFNLHSTAFLPVVLSQGSFEQVNTIGKLAMARAIIGAYAQTELAHGTQVSHLETTATYIPETQEFELFTPRLESCKWWIGGLARTASHCVIQARLVLPEGDKGPHLFLLQLRNLDDYSVRPGITIGDIGSKSYGAHSAVDNGFMRLDRVRVPLSAMLSRFASVTQDGKYNKPIHAKLGYGGMVYIRSRLISQGGWFTAKAITIAIRYATVRRQGGGPRGHERQVITYPSTYHRLLPILSRAYVWIFIGRTMIQLYNEMATQLSQDSITLLAETHAVSSGLKVLVTSISAEDLETARRSMGGHGFSAAAGIGNLWAQWVPSNTYEGDNYVLVQQVVQAAVKNLQSVLSSSIPSDAVASLPPFLRCFRHLFSSQSAPADPFSVFGAIHLLELRGAHMVYEHIRRIHAKETDGSADWRVSRAITEAFVAQQVGELIKGMDKHFSPKSADQIYGLLRLYLLTTLESSLVDLLSLNLLPLKTVLPSVSPSQDKLPQCQSHTHDCTRELRGAIMQLEEELLPEAIGLTDSFGFTDWELNSALGVRDGRVYENLWDSAQVDPLNETEVVGYKEYIKSILEHGQNSLGFPAKL